MSESAVDPLLRVVEQHEVSSGNGKIDAMVEGAAVGWAYDASKEGEALRVQVRAGARVLGTGLADRHSEAVARAGMGDGRHAFRIELSLPFSSGTCVELTLHEADSGLPLVGDSLAVSFHDPANLDARELTPRSALAPPLTPRAGGFRVRRVRKVVGRVVRPLRRLLETRLFKTRLSNQPDSTDAVQPSKPIAGALPGAVAKLARLEDGAVGALSRIGSWAPLVLPPCEHPCVSVILPVHNQFHLTYQCLVSLILGAGKIDFEVILIDDCSTDATREIESCVSGLRVVRNAENLGFLRSCQRAADESRADYLLFLNNDTEVENGWIDEMHDVFARFDNVGAVGAKLVYPDGSLQDAGGIVWESGTPWNVGHGADPADPEYNYVREVDYLTGAALMVNREAWERVDGFSDEYAPAYYEDTDLAFKLRAAGYRTLYCPQATVVHYEGRSNGTSLESGVKQFQLVNAEHFRTTWAKAFEGNGREGVDLRRNKDRRRGLRVLMLDHEFPRIGRDAGSYAAVQEMRLLMALGCKLTFLPYNMGWAGRHVDTLQRLGVECVHAPWYPSAEGFLKARAAEFDVIYITRYTVAERVLALAREKSNAKIVLNNADLHFLREMRAALWRGDADLEGPRRTRVRELAVMDAVDAVLSYNEVEQAIIASHLMRSDHVFGCPWVLDLAPSSASLDDRHGIAFLGGFGHPPNREAVDWFIDQVMPLLRAARPDIELHVWGSRLPADADWNERDGVVVEGYAEELGLVFDTCRVFVAPLLSGAGIKGKVLDSMARGVPAVLSPVAAEGTGLVDGVSTAIARSPDDWVRQIIALVDDDDRWRAFSSASMEVVGNRYSFAHGVQEMREVFEYLGLETQIDSRKVA